jgi:MFS family permease
VDIPDPLTSPELSRATRLVATAGAVVGLAILGDSLLYNILPLAAAGLGIPAVLVGVLLSANRVVRLVSNTAASRLFERMGPRIPFIAATVLALAATTTYGMGWGFLAFLAARAVWGISWSALRQGGFQAIWAGGEQAHGRLMGLFLGIVRLGSAASVLLGGYLYDRFSYRSAVLAAACLTALAIPLALSYRWPASASAPSQPPSGRRDWGSAVRTPRQRNLLASGFAHGGMEGVVTSTLSLFVAGRLQTDGLLGPATIAGILLAVRHLSSLVLGPGLGALSDRLGQPRLAIILVGAALGSVSAMTLIKGPSVVLPAALLVMTSSGLYVILSAAASGVALGSDRPHLYVGAYTTAADAGLAVGPPLVFSLSGALGLGPVYLASAGLLLLTVLRYALPEMRPRATGI